jgi:acetyl esterase
MANVVERIEWLGARAIAALPSRAARLLAGRPVRVDGQVLDPHSQIAIRRERLLGGELERDPVKRRERRRRDARVHAGRRIEIARTQDLELPGPAGPIGARLYVPADRAEPQPLLVHYHGGGHVVGDLDTHDQNCRFLAREVPALVLAIDYRLAPEHPFPAAVDDALAAFRWAHAQAARLGVDPERIAVVGDSAGGNLAAVVAQLAVADGGPAPAFQALLYPVIDYSADRRSNELFGEGFFLTNAEMDWYRGHYLPNPEDRLDPRASPILADDLAGVAPAFVLTAGFDPLRDEGEDYAARLRDAGVPTTLRREPDLMHAFANAVGLGGRVRAAMTEVAAAIRAGLEPGPPGPPRIGTG